MLTFIDFFAGVGGFRRGMELTGNKCVGFCEFDKYATASYISMHLLTDKQREYLKTLKLKERQKQLFKKEEYKNGEWYANDIRNVNAGNIPKADCWCFGAPCQDFSIAGNRKGLDGDRSSLVREVFRIIAELETENRPKYLIYENVKGMLSNNKGWDFACILVEMESLGYDIEYQLVNSKDFGIPQNRERVYTVGHLRGRSTTKIFPIGGYSAENCVEQVGRVHGKNRDNPHVMTVCNINPSGNGMNGNVYSSHGLSPTLTTNKGEGIKVAFKINSSQDGTVVNTDGVSPTHTAGHGNCPKVAISVLTPGRIEKRQNGRRFKEPGDQMFTLTAQDRHGVAIGVTENKTNDGIYVEFPNGVIAYAIWYEKYQCYVAIRKLTPRECWRLQGWSDAYFDRAALVNSDSQLYKQAGNSVTVSVVYEIAKKLL